MSRAGGSWRGDKMGRLMRSLRASVSSRLLAKCTLTPIFVDEVASSQHEQLASRKVYSDPNFRRRPPQAVWRRLPCAG